MKKPEGPTDERDGEPYYIDNECNKCGSELVEVEYDESEVHDEWECPECQDSIYMDWPDRRYNELEKRSEEFDEQNTITTDDLRSKLNIE